MNRIWNVVRLHNVNPWSYVGRPWMILGIIFVVMYAIWQLLSFALDGQDRIDAIDGMTYNGAILSIFIYMMVVAIQSINLTFPFALGFSITRRDFYLGTSLLFLLLSAGNAILMTILATLETATGGWGLGGRLFTSFWFGDGPWYVHLMVFFLLQLFFFFVGAAIATIYMRWKINGMITFWAALLLFLVGLAALATYTNSWGAVGAWFMTNGTTGVIAWTIVPTALAALCGFFVLRRATPKS